MRITDKEELIALLAKQADEKIGDLEYVTAGKLAELNGQARNNVYGKYPVFKEIGKIEAQIRKLESKVKELRRKAPMAFHDCVDAEYKRLVEGSDDPDIVRLRNARKLKQQIPLKIMMCGSSKEVQQLVDQFKEKINDV